MRTGALGLGVCALAACVAVACGSRTGLESPVVEDVVGTEAGVPPGHHGRAPLDCAEAGITYIYAIGEDNQIYSFYPTTAEFTPIGTLDCPAAPTASPFSMAVDHTGVAYVVFSDGTLYRVSTKTAVCEATPFVPDQQGFLRFGMGFVANVGDGGSGETLYVASGEANQEPPEPDALATIDLTTFTLHPVAAFQATAAGMVIGTELTGTGDGRLFGFYAPNPSSAPSFIVQLDPRTAAVLSSTLLPDVVQGSGWAFGFWGGDFYTFTAPQPELPTGEPTTVVTRYRPTDGSVTQVATAPPGVLIVGAGVSTCAPQQ